MGGVTNAVVTDRKSDGKGARPKAIKLCPECDQPHSRARSRFCSVEHQRAFDNRAKVEGRRIIALAKAWALGRGGGHTSADPVSRQAMREMTQILKSLNDTDREKGRMSALEYAALLMANGSRWFDRQRG